MASSRLPARPSSRFFCTKCSQHEICSKWSSFAFSSSRERINCSDFITITAELYLQSTCQRAVFQCQGVQWKAASSICIRFELCLSSNLGTNSLFGSRHMNNKKPLVCNGSAMDVHRCCWLKLNQWRIVGKLRMLWTIGVCCKDPLQQLL
jgi:hypothetical protein